MNREYNFLELEKKWRRRWQDGGHFSLPDRPTAPAYTVLMPPPNVTGVLHMGHLLNDTLQDILLRRARQLGLTAFWQVGTDHAGISLQVKVEKDLMARGIDPKSLDRSAFLDQARRWRDGHSATIFQQLEALNLSCDYGRRIHTLDADYSRTVLHGFVELFRRGHIYRGRRMVNWCPVSQTALSDEEVLMQPQKGKLYRIRYELVEFPGKFIEVATTRPETIAGDLAIAVHPADGRYKDLLGKHCWRPFARQAIPIIADGAVDPDFGTGALKITPAHDPVDFAIGQRHGLGILEIIDANGRLTADEPMRGMDRFEARVVAAERLDEMGLLVDVREHDHAVGISERSGVAVEPRLSEQWFLRYPQVERAKEVVKRGLITFHPQRWTKTYLHWLDSIHDWCISRQLRWGHRIPVWYRRGRDRSDPANWHVSIDGPEDPENWEQDPDVLDTWFSSAFWPLGTLGWPDGGAMELRHFNDLYPTAVLVTGPDIIFFWVTRMIIMALEFLPGPLERIVPFRAVYFTGIVRDGLGRKMSKSLGNSPEPMELIGKYGSDGVRFGLIAIAPQGQDVLFDERRLEQGRNFCTKLWNACRLRLSFGGLAQSSRSFESVLEKLSPERMTMVDQVMVHDLLRLMERTEFYFSQYQFNGALQNLERYFRGDYCDWYLEVVKIQRRLDPTYSPALQDLILRLVLQLLHPFIPVITEELWKALDFEDRGGSMETIPLPTAQDLADRLRLQGLVCGDERVREIAELREVVAALRFLRSKIVGRCDVLCCHSEGCPVQLARHSSLLLPLLGLETMACVPLESGVPVATTVWGTFSLRGQTRVDAKLERQNLVEEMERLLELNRNNRQRLQNEAFLQKAPQKIIGGLRAMVEENERKIARLKAILDRSE